MRLVANLPTSGLADGPRLLIGLQIVLQIYNYKILFLKDFYLLIGSIVILSNKMGNGVTIESIVSTVEPLIEDLNGEQGQKCRQSQVNDP